MDDQWSMFLYAGIKNARYQLGDAIAAYAAGTLDKPHDPHALAVLYRHMGVCRLLTTGVAEPLFIAQMQSVSAYLHRLPMLPEDDKVTSRGGVFWDAIGGEYWDAAAEIVRHSRASVNPTWEHEDDFLYVWFLMTRYFPEDERQRAAPYQQALLDRWTTVLMGGYDPRHSLCDALLHRDSRRFCAVFDEVADFRETRLRHLLDKGQLPKETTVWSLPIWPEGLALLRLAERDGLETDEHCKGVPQVIRAANPYRYDGEAWRQIDVKVVFRG
ncbi:MAG: hypothetical protein AAGF11_20440 [Myxococcota bacterium]